MECNYEGKPNITKLEEQIYKGKIKCYYLFPESGKVMACYLVADPTNK
jgi:hypothetical protein